MRTRITWPSLAILFLGTGIVLAGKLSPDDKLSHALDRLTFGARPGDLEAVRKTGLKKWIDQQLHPERIAENPALEQKLASLDTLRMSPREMAEKYPPPQRIKALAEGRMPMPQDPAARQRLQPLIDRYQQRQNRAGKGAEAGTKVPLEARATGLLTEEQRQQLREGTPEERRAVFQSLPADTREKIAAAFGGGGRGLAEGAQMRREFAAQTAPMAVIAMDLNEAKLDRAILSERQLAEVLTDFWFNHFNVYLDKGADRLLVTSYERDAVRPHILGKFKDLLLATARHPAMLFYLDNWQSVDPRSAAARAGRRSKGLNENYARELMELHTLGVDGGYTQADVTEVARCFTGWTLRNPRQGGGFWFAERAHDRGVKTVLGVRIPAGRGEEDGLQVIDLLAKHPSTARFLSRKLAQRFVADEPPASLVEKMANRFQSSDGDLREVLKTMLDSPEFWSEKYYRVKIKSPLELVASAARAMDAQVDSGLALGRQVARLGQPLYRKQEPTGYPNTSSDWMNSAALVARMNFASALAENRIPGVQVRMDRIPTLPVISPPTQAAIEKAEPGKVAGLLLGSPDFQRR